MLSLIYGYTGSRGYLLTWFSVQLVYVVVDCRSTK